MNNEELMLLREKLNDALCDEELDYKKVLSISQEVDILILKFYKRAAATEAS